MMVNKGLFTSTTDEWATPQEFLMGGMNSSISPWMLVPIKITINASGISHLNKTD